MQVTSDGALSDEVHEGALLPAELAAAEANGFGYLPRTIKPPPVVDREAAEGSGLRRTDDACAGHIGRQAIEVGAGYPFDPRNGTCHSLAPSPATARGSVHHAQQCRALQVKSCESRIAPNMSQGF